MTISANLKRKILNVSNAVRQVQDLLRNFKERGDSNDCQECRFDRLMKIPTTDVQPVVHGRWIPMTYIRELTENGWPNCRWEKAIEPDSVDGLMCLECGEIFDVADARNFCAQCGSDMRQRSIK